MMAKLIFKEDVKGLLNKARKNFDVYFPKKDTCGDCQFVNLNEEKDSLSRLSLDTYKTIVSPKDIFFPQIERMFVFKKDKIEETIVSSKNRPRVLPRLIFGIRACDLKGLQFCDEFFKRNFKDKYYLRGAKNKFTIVIGCILPPRQDKCFCTSSRTGPFLKEGYDLQFTDLADVFFVEIGSKEGRDFIKKYKQFFKPAHKKDLLASEKIKKSAFNALKLKVDFFGAVEYLMKKDIPVENYKRIAERCIYCGGCLYVCPTCTCFNVFDYKDARFRCWDSCVFEGYSREAGGNNPRKYKWQRTARRYEHKLKYDYLATGISSCVGCGRCLDSCPVDIGISKFIQEITENKKLM